ncbi:MAG: hypothetical protein QOG59_2567, partial [Solirubrobacteraceae bacterium]|nr:hypothetical protein [Solirubrobacteraceae bacterium]
MIGRTRAFRPFAATGRRIIVGIFVTFGLIFGVTMALSISATSRSQNRATVVEVAGRQRTLAERYVQDVLLVRAGQKADPALTASLLMGSARALLNGGAAPSVNGDDDGTNVAAASGAVLRRQLVEEQHLIGDLGAAGSALLSHRSPAAAPVSGGERIVVRDPLMRLRILGALTSAVALGVARTVAAEANAQVSRLIVIQVALGIGGLLISLLLAWALMATTRRQTAHFRSLVVSSSGLVVVVGAAGCRYASRSMSRLVGRPESDLLGEGFAHCVHEEDHALLAEAQGTGQPHELTLRVHNAAGEWRHLEAQVNDLRQDRNIRGVVLNARDVTERVRLQHEVRLQSQRDTFGGELIEALEMADEEETAYEVVERAMVEISAELPMELLLSDSSRAHLERVVSSPAAGAPGCPVQSPFSCVAVRRGQPVSFESSEALNACPKLRGRPGGTCSAVCVPVSFMGRALGVVHATGPEGAPPDAEALSQLTLLATQAGARIGTVRAFAKTQLQAATDGLTGLSNRRTFETEVGRRIRTGHSFAIAIGDLDHFKAINDTHGHEAGDRALRLFSQVTQAALRDDDVMSRWGGEEFAFALPNLTGDEAVSVLDRVRERLVEAHVGDHPRFTASFGVADTGMAETLEQLISLADIALYEAKEGGRDRVCLARPQAETPPADDPRKPRSNGHANGGGGQPQLQ